MATDMGEHMAIVSKLKTEIQKRMENPDDEIGDDPQESLRILVMQVCIHIYVTAVYVYVCIYVSSIYVTPLRIPRAS